MKEAISPSIGLTLWSAFCIVVLAIAFLSLVYFIFKRKKKGTPSGIVSALILTGFIQSCNSKYEEPVPVSPITALSAEYNIKVVGKNEMPANALHFSSTEEARSFLKKFSKSNLSPKAEVLTAYRHGLPSNISSELLDRASGRLPSDPEYITNAPIPPWDENFPELPPIDGGGPPTSGTAIISQHYMPWNSVETTLYWSGGHVTSLSTQLSGVTVGINWVQTGWHDTGYHNGNYTFTVTYHVDVTMFVEGIGTVYTGQSSIGYGTYNPDTGQGGLYTPVQ
jgi:hypothetical protein